MTRGSLAPIRRDLLAAILAATVSAAAAAWLLQWFGAVRYQDGLIVNIHGLLLITLVFAVFGVVLALVGTVQILLKRRLPTWIRFSIGGIVLACCAALALAIVGGDCLPNCKGGRGDLISGLLLAVPAGFAAGAMCYGAWILFRGAIGQVGERYAHDDV